MGGDKAVDGGRNTRWATSGETRACWLEVDRLREATFAPSAWEFELFPAS